MQTLSHPMEQAPQDIMQFMANPTVLGYAIGMYRRKIEMKVNGDIGVAENLMKLSILLKFSFDNSSDKLGNRTILEEAITTARLAVELTPSMHPGKLDRLKRFSNHLLLHFNHFEDLSSLEEAISAARCGVGITANNHPDKPTWLNNLSNHLSLHFRHFRDVSSLEEAISTAHCAIKHTPDTHSARPRHLNNLSNYLSLHFDHFGDECSLKEAVSTARCAVVLTLDNDTDKPAYLSNLSNHLSLYFAHFGDVSSLEEAVTTARCAVKLILDNNPDRPACLNSLSSQLLSYFSHSGDLPSLREAISTAQQAVKLTSDDDINKSAYLNNLSNCFSSHFERFRDSYSLEKAISAARHVVELMSNQHSDKPECLCNLSSHLASCFSHFGDLPSLEEAISIARSAVKLSPFDSSAKGASLYNLSNQLSLHYSRFGDVSSLEEAISTACYADKLKSDDDKDKPAYLSNLSSCYSLHFRRFGEITSLEEAIATARRAVKLTSKEDSGKPGYLNNLSCHLSLHFSRFKDVSSLNEAVYTAQCAVEATTDDHPCKPGYLNNLSVHLSLQSDQDGNISCLEEAIANARDAVKLMLDDNHPDKTACLNSLSTHLYSHFHRIGDVSSLEDAISTARLAVKLTPDAHPNKPACLNNLSNHLFSHFGRFEDVSSLEDAISTARLSVELTPDAHPDKPARLNNLSNLLSSRSRCFADESSLEDAFHSSRQAGNARSGPPLERLRGARRAAKLSLLLFPNKLAVQDFLDAHHRVVELIPEVAWLGEGLGRRYEELVKIGDAVNEAARAAIMTNHLEQALEWLEQGRGIVWGQLLQLRMPKDDLQEQHPSLYKELEDISRQLQSSETTHVLTTDAVNTLAKMSPEAIATKYRLLADRYDKLIAQIRELEGFERFLLPKTMEELTPAAKGGPVVIINVCESQCDALILCPSGSLLHVPLRALTRDDLKQLGLDLKSNLSEHGIYSRVSVDFKSFRQTLDGNGLKSVLRNLWSKLVQPILKELGDDLHGHQQDRLPHITWCTTGPLSFLPIHAAGIYDAEDGEAQLKLHDLVVSSYTTTLSALIRQSQLTDSTSKRDILIVSQPATPGLSRIPLTEREAEKVKVHFPDRALWLNDKEATRSVVHEAMSKYKWIHLACHGTQNRKDPLNSAFHLYDGRLDLQQLMSQSSNDAELAVLSACETAMGNPELPEEMVHLTAGMLSAGFRSVVGTMWSIQDADGPRIADKFYEKLMDKANHRGELGRFEAAYALHDAVTHLRAAIGTNKFHRWIPFVHFGM